MPARDYRGEARTLLERARRELDSGDDKRLRYAALELRLAMEAITYDRAHAYRTEIPPQEYETWQPRKVLQLLLEIDPNVDKDSIVRFGLEETPGEPPKEMRTLGSEKVLNLAALKKHYDALGSYLHMPTLKRQAEGDHPNSVKLRDRCDRIATDLENVLASPIFNVTLGQFATFDCQRCHSKIRKRMLFEESQLDVKCFNCGAEYSVLKMNEGEVVAKPKTEEIECPGNGCKGKITLWHDELVVGTWWTCKDCSEAFELCMGIRRKEAHQTE